MIKWQDVAVKLLVLTQQVTDEKRDEVIVDIEALLDERDQLQSDILAPFTAEEEVFGKELVAMEADVQKKLALFTKRIRKDISEAQSKKDHVKSYVNPYRSLGRDGTFYDTKQ
ncbi:hypothetical protein [Sporosarcina limicola]|uniref:Flagellar protein FliT n=1 Tax=Sporosarcina limicola TaxID=34101 RepID=A0A927MJE6_9BACL|nr:hypothetical protein [Sporosarcina limicola]MBE1555028.1 flagellar protein FliT [Sporosarcina limicola]